MIEEDEEGEETVNVHTMLAITIDVADRPADH